MNICKYMFSCFLKKEEELLNKSKDSDVSLSSNASTVVTTKIIDANEKKIYTNNIITNYEC